MNLRALIVSVEYSDYLAITLPYNRHHFSDILVVTSMSDHKTMKVCMDNKVLCYRTDCFYDDGAPFNKYKALERGLDRFGRRGWLCLLDADILWPKSIPDFGIMKGCIYTPLRRNLPDFNGVIPPEEQWYNIPLHRNQVEWAGWTQIFHAEDYHLGTPPWHEQDWCHAGGGDSMFQRKWPKECKIRPPFKVLHLSHHGQNWCGRSTPMLDGTILPKSKERKSLLEKMRSMRSRNRNFDHEKIGLIHKKSPTPDKQG